MSIIIFSFLVLITACGEDEKDYSSLLESVHVPDNENATTEQKAEYFNASLNLSLGQIEQIKKIVDDYRLQLAKNTLQMNREELTGKILTILTEEQKVQFNRMSKEGYYNSILEELKNNFKEISTRINLTLSQKNSLEGLLKADGSNELNLAKNLDAILSKILTEEQISLLKEFLAAKKFERSKKIGDIRLDK